MILEMRPMPPARCQILDFLVPDLRKRARSSIIPTHIRPTRISCWSRIATSCCLSTASLSEKHARTAPSQQPSLIRAPKPRTPSKSNKVSTGFRKEDLESALQAGRAILANQDSIPNEEAILAVFKNFQSHAHKLVEDEEDGRQRDGKLNKSSTLNDVLSLSESSAKPRKNAQRVSVAAISRLALDIITKPNVFISSEILSSYVQLQSSLKSPETIPPALSLFANKLIPIQGSSPIRFEKPWSNAPKSAIPVNTADLALESAIAAGDLAAALSVIETAYAAKAFRRRKFVRKASIPATALVLSPAAAYVIATKLATLHPAAEAYLSPSVAFTGIMAYVGFTSAVGLLAITTANDQMERVTWAQGTALRERWIREEERAAYDKLALAWGFKQVSRWGEEEGEEWEYLREIIGRRGMILDRAELMDGME